MAEPDELARRLMDYLRECRDTRVDGFPLESPAPLAALLNDPNLALTRLRLEIGECSRCPLHQGRTHLVFGEGSPKARLMFVGEGPGEQEDKTGRPFVGRAGQLLTDIIEKGMGLARADVYIANIVKCRPPGNRTPHATEAEVCIRFLRKQIEIIKPQVIVALGSTAFGHLTGQETPISRARGRWHRFGPTKLMPTFHPSYLLRNEAAKKDVWKDVQLVLQELGLPLPKRRG